MINVHIYSNTAASLAFNYTKRIKRIKLAIKIERFGNFFMAGNSKIVTATLCYYTQ